MMFSATLPENIVRMSRKYLKEPKRITVGSTNTAHTNIKQELIKMGEGEKYQHLLAQLGQREGSVIIFVKTKYGTEKLSDRLNKDQHKSDAIHGDLQQRRRDRVIQGFRDKRYRILVATDVAARGLDIPHIEHVINYDLPQCPEDYIHRIGRTARAGAEGCAVNFLTNADHAKWNAIHRLMNPGAPQAANSDNRREGGRGAPGGRRGQPQRKRWGAPGAARTGDDRRSHSAGGERRSFGEGRGGERPAAAEGEHRTYKPRSEYRGDAGRPAPHVGERPRHTDGERPSHSAGEHRSHKGGERPSHSSGEHRGERKSFGGSQKSDGQRRSFGGGQGGGYKGNRTGTSR